MARAGYRSARQLARDLETDSSLGGKWLRGKPQRVTLARHQENLARLLKTPPDYWIDVPPARLEELADQLAEAVEGQTKLSHQVRRLQARVRQLEAQSARGSDVATEKS